MKNIVLGVFLAVLVLASNFVLAQVPPPANYGQSLKWLERAAASGDAAAQFLLARKLESGLKNKPDIANAAKWYAKAANLDYGPAQFRLGELFYAGQGLNKDLAQAAKWFERAVEQGSMRAAYNLGLMNERGIGVEKKFARASALYLQAANAGIAQAQVSLAFLFFQGKGVLKDNGRALMWLEVAMRSGEKISTVFLEGLKAKMSPGEVESAIQMALNRKAQIKQKAK